MRAQDPRRLYPAGPYPAGIRYFYYLPGEDFQTWRYQFEGIADRYQWTNTVTKQFAFAYMSDTATQTVIDILSMGQRPRSNCWMPTKTGFAWGRTSDYSSSEGERSRSGVASIGLLKGGVSSSRDRNGEDTHQLVPALSTTQQLTVSPFASRSMGIRTRRSPCP